MGAWLIAACLIFPSSTTPARAETAATYRLMTYNVGSAASLPLGRRQIGLIADTIIDNRVDVAGFNEVEVGTVWHDGRDHIAELLVALADRGYPMHVHRWPSHPLQKGYHLQALLSRLPIEAMGYDVVERAIHNRWCMGWVRLRVAEGTLIQAGGTHIWPVGKSDDDLRRHIAGQAGFDGPCTIMGDFNLTPDSGLYPLFAKAGFRNSCEVANGARCPSVQGTAGVAGPLPLNHQIDFIFVNPRVEVKRSCVGYYSMSDHWPVFAEVRVPVTGRITPPSLPDTSAQRRDAGLEREAVMRHYRAGRYAEAARACDAWEQACARPDNAGFAAYTRACMVLLTGDDAAGAVAFGAVIASHPNTEWAARSAYQRAFIHRRAGECAAAERSFIDYLDGYYEVIHPDVKAPAARITAGEIVACRDGTGEKRDATRVLEELAARSPTAPSARAAAYTLARQAHDAGNTEAAIGYFRQADPEPRGMWPDEARPCAEIWLAAGEPDKADAFYQRYLAAFDNVLHYRVRAARWARRIHPERFAARVPRLKNITIDGDLAEWSQPPMVTLQGAPYLYRADPIIEADEHAARVWIGHNADDLLLAVEVVDGTHFCPYAAGDIYKGDCLQVAIDPAGDASGTYNADDVEFGVALTDQGVRTHVWVDGMKRDWTGLRCAVRRTDGRTAYELAIPLGLLKTGDQPPSTLGFNLLVSDADSGDRLGWVDWTPGIGEEKLPVLYPRLTLVP